VPADSRYRPVVALRTAARRRRRPPGRLSAPGRSIRPLTRPVARPWSGNDAPKLRPNCDHAARDGQGRMPGSDHRSGRWAV